MTESTERRMPLVGGPLDGSDHDVAPYGDNFLGLKFRIRHDDEDIGQVARYEVKEWRGKKVLMYSGDQEEQQ